MDKPTIYLTNWGSKRHHGPGRKLTIMARPRAWEHGAGTVHALCPRLGDLDALKAGDIDAGEYFARFRGELDERLSQHSDRLSPGRLMFRGSDGLSPLVADGDTLLCACAVGAPCHRREAAPYLVRAGWRVLLDGVEVTDV